MDVRRKQGKEVCSGGQSDLYKTLREVSEKSTHNVMIADKCVCGEPLIGDLVDHKDWRGQMNTLHSFVLYCTVINH